MTPDVIKSVIEAAFPDIRSKPRRNPYGWAFYLGTIREAPNSTRTARAVQRTLAGRTQFKLSVTSRVSGVEALREVHSAEEVRALITEEIRLWHRDYGADTGAR